MTLTFSFAELMDLRIALNVQIEMQRELIEKDADKYRHLIVQRERLLRLYERLSYP